jgi:hypothetical protein
MIKPCEVFKTSQVLMLQKTKQSYGVSWKMGSDFTVFILSLFLSNTIYYHQGE